MSFSNFWVIGLFCLRFRLSRFLFRVLWLASVLFRPLVVRFTSLWFGLGGLVHVDVIQCPASSVFLVVWHCALSCLLVGC